MPPLHIRPNTTDPSLPLSEFGNRTPIAPESKPRGRFSRLLGGKGLDATEPMAPVENLHDLHMNIAETYDVSWDIEKCARDAWQNFFDANGGTLDGVDMDLEERAGEVDGKLLHDVIIRGGGSYDYRDLTILGATSKQTGEMTAGGFGEGAKVLSLVLLRDYGVERVVYRSNDWQLDFFLNDLPEGTAARPTRGLFARVATGLNNIDGSEMMISCSDSDVAHEIADARRLFNSSENPDFQNVTIEKELPDGSRAGIKFLGVEQDGGREKLAKGNLYIAGQRREYNRYGRDSGWETVEGLSVFTTKDIAAGDRDRGGIPKNILDDELLRPLSNIMDAGEVKGFLESLEPNYSSNLLELSELDTFLKHVLQRGKDIGVSMEFDSKYIACNPFLPFDTRRMLEDQGLTLCDRGFGDIGMRTSSEAIKAIHEHQRIESSPEHEKKMDILHQALGILSQSEQKEFEHREIALYSKSDENNPAHGTYSEEYVWLAVEHIEEEGFAKVFATYLHELDHKYGSDHSSEFSYALTDTLAAILDTIARDANAAQKWHGLASQWLEIEHK